MQDRSPFKFLDAFTLKDKNFFFGRKKEINSLFKMVFETPLVLIYGLSGTGKTSLVQCGLASRFEGPDWLPFFIRRNENINLAMHVELDKCILRDTNMALNEKISYLSMEYLRPVYLIFDQFEELFILGSKEEQNKFIQDIKYLIDAKLHCKVIFIIREEYLGELYDFEKVIPFIYDHRLRVEPMNVTTTSEVLTSSFDKFNIKLEDPEEARIQQIIKNISGEKSGIQLPYLQVYLDMLYREDFKRDFPNGTSEEYPELTFTKAEIEEFGQIDNVLETFLEEQKTALQKVLKSNYEAPENVTADILDAFVTEEGTKRPFYFTRENDLILVSPQLKRLLPPNIQDEAISYAIEALEKRRILRYTTDTTFELAHDSLANLIDQKRTDEQRQRNEVMRSLVSNFKEFPETNQLLSEPQLNRYEPFIPFLNINQEINDYIDKSYKKVQKDKAKEKAELAEKEKVKQERKRAKLRNRLLWVIGAFAVTAAGFGVYALEQRDLAEANELKAKKSEKEVIISNYKNLYGVASTFKAKGDYKNASDKIGDAMNFRDSIIVAFNNRNEVIPDLFVVGKVDSLKTYQKNWLIVDSLLNEANRFYDESLTNDSLNLNLLSALAIFERAKEYDFKEAHIQNEIKKTKDMIEQKYKKWIERAIQFTHYKQCKTAKKALKYVKKLNLDPSNSTRAEIISKIIVDLANRREKGECY